MLGLPHPSLSLAEQQNRSTGGKVSHRSAIEPFLLYFSRGKPLAIVLIKSARIFKTSPLEDLRHVFMCEVLAKSRIQTLLLATTCFWNYSAKPQMPVRFGFAAWLQSTYEATQANLRYQGGLAPSDL